MVDIRHGTKNGDEIMTLSGALTVKHAKALKAAFIEVLQKTSVVEVAVESISDLDISFAQLVCSAHRMAAGLNKQLTITGLEQERINQMLDHFGFYRHIGCNEINRKSCLWQNCQEAPYDRPASRDQTKPA